MSHIPDPTAHLDPSAKKIFNDICEKRNGCHAAGLFPMLMNYPALAEQFNSFSSFLRFDGELANNYREFTILTLASHLDCTYELDTHRAYAKAAGLSDELIQLVSQHQFNKITDPVYTDINQAVEIFLNKSVMPQALQDRLTNKLGWHGFIQLCLLTGWYRMIATFVTAFEFPLV